MKTWIVQHRPESTHAPKNLPWCAGWKRVESSIVWPIGWYATEAEALAGVERAQKKVS